MQGADGARSRQGLPAIADDSGIEAAALGGRPGVLSARYAGENATDTENLALLIRELREAEDRSVAYVCALAYVGADGEEHLFEGRCEGELARDPRGDNGFGYDPAFVPGTSSRPTTARWPSSATTRSMRSATAGRAAGELAAHLGLAGDEACTRGAAMIRTKTGAATLSVASNSVLIALKLAAGAITGSIAIITEALHSAIDLMASVIALVSVRKADEPADAEHPYGHEKVENLAAAIEGMLILVGAGVIVYEATRRLAKGAERRLARTTSASASP